MGEQEAVLMNELADPANGDVVERIYAKFMERVASAAPAADRLAIVRVSLDLLRQMLHLPANARIVAATDQAAGAFDQGELWLKIACDDFPEVKPGSAVPALVPLFRSEFRDGGHTEVTVDWRLP